ncbi:MAG: BACON domain-containing protein [Bacteroidales bacterium]|nr:BACON domain-containing protein [Bacteroidales bacterium]
MKRLFLFLVLAASLSACIGLPQLDVDRTSLSFSDEGGKELISVTTNVSWSATASASWINVQYTEGSNTLTVTVLRNGDPSDRQGSVTVTGGELSRTISVTQSCAPVQTARINVTGVTCWQVPLLGGDGVSGTLSCAGTETAYRDGLQLELSADKDYSVRLDARYAKTITFATVEGIVELDLTDF